LTVARQSPTFSADALAPWCRSDARIHSDGRIHGAHGASTVGVDAHPAGKFGRKSAREVLSELVHCTHMPSAFASHAHVRRVHDRALTCDVCECTRVAMGVMDLGLGTVVRATSRTPS
jgi:hypothetical protein